MSIEIICAVAQERGTSMYDVTNRSRKELVIEICRVLNEHGFEDMEALGHKHEYKPGSGFGEGLMFMPIENLVKIIQCPITDWSDFGKVYNAWGRAGALRFEPYMTDEDDNPTLVIRHNRYLHMFRGYHFQASGTIGGVGDCGSGSYRTDFLCRPHYSNHILCNGLITYMLWWAAFIDVGFKFDNFIELFNSNRAVLDEFLTTSIKYWRGPENYQWSDVEKYIEIGKGNIDVYNRKVYQLQKKDGGIDAYLAIGLNTVQVETAGNKLVTIKIPNLNEGAEYNLADEDDKECYDEEVGILESNHFREMLLVMAVKLAGLDLNFMGYHFLWEPEVKQRMRPINAPGVIITKSLNEIYKAEPDNY